MVEESEFHQGKYPCALIPKAIKAGVKFALGVDPCHGFLWKEAKYTVESGIPEMEVLLAVTKNGAELCGIEDRVGTLEADKLGGVISVKGNPLDDIKCLRNVGLIMKGGKRYDQLLERGSGFCRPINE